MAATLTEVRNGIKARLATIAGLSAYAIEPPSPKYPAAWTFPLPESEYDNDFDGKTLWRMQITVAVAASELAHAQTNLDPYLAPQGTKSIRAAIEGDVTLGGVVDYAVVKRLTGYSGNAVSGGASVMATLALEVIG